MKLKRFIAGIMAVALWAMIIAPSTPAYASTLVSAPAADVIISGTGVTAPARYTTADIEALSSSTPYIYSSRNDYNFYRTYTAYGVPLATLLSTSGGSLSSPIAIVAGDGFEVDFGMAGGGEPSLSQTRYYFPNANSGTIDGENHWESGQGSPFTDGAKPVDSILSYSATYVTADPGSNPSQTPSAVPNQPRLIIGQIDPQDYNTAKYTQTTGGTTQIVVGAQDTTPVLTVNGTSYSAQQLLGKPAVTGSFTYAASGGDKTDSVMGVSLASLLSGAADSDTVTFTAWDSAQYSTDGYTMTKEQLLAANAVLAFSVNGAPVKNATYGPSPTLYLDGMKPAKNIMNVVSSATAPQPAVAVAVAPTSASVLAGNTVKLTATVTPETATAGVTWSSNDASIATVAPDGTVTGVAAGSATITATSKDDPTKSATAQITVTDESLVLAIRGSGYDIDYTLSQLKAMTPVSGAYTYTSSTGDKTDYVQGASLADVLAGVPDNAIISFTAADGYSTAGYTMTKAELVAADAVLAYSKGASAAELAPVTNAYNNAPTLYLNGKMPSKNTSQIDVTIPVSVAVSPQTGAIDEGKTIAVSATVSPATATGGVTWTSSDPDVATIAAAGTSATVTGVAPGTALITATSVDDPSKSDTMVLTVNEVPLSVAITQASFSLPIGGQATATATITPPRQSDTGVTWSVGDTLIATVDPTTGVITGAGVGSTQVIATSIADPTKSASAPITVTEPDVLTVTGTGGYSASYLLSQLEAMTPTFGSYTYPASGGDKTDYVKGTLLADILDKIPGITDDSVVSFTAGDGDQYPTTSYTMTKAELVAANAVLAYEKGTSSDDLAAVTNSYNNAPTLYLDGMKPAKNIIGVNADIPEPAPEPVTVTVAPKTLTLAAGDTSTPLTAQVSPATKTGGVTWTSSDKSVATVSATGAVTGVKAGVAIITATSVDDPQASASATVTVTAAAKNNSNTDNTNSGTKSKAAATTSVATTSTATTSTASSSLPTTGDSLGLGGIFLSTMALAFTLSFLVSSRRRRYI